LNQEIEMQQETQQDDGMQQENINNFIINFCNNERVNIQIERISLRDTFSIHIFHL